MSTGGAPTTDRTSRLTRALVLAALLLLLGAAAAYVVATVIVPRGGGDVDSGVACEDLPPTADVEEAITSHRRLTEVLSEVEGGNAWVEAGSDCGPGFEDRAEALIYVSSRSLSARIQQLLEEEPLGVPFSIRNV